MPKIPFVSLVVFLLPFASPSVAVLDAEPLWLVDHYGSAHQGRTHDVDFDKAGRLYVADTHNGRVTIYEISGAGDGIKWLGSHGSEGTPPDRLGPG